MRHVLHPEADAELAEAVGYYSEIAPDLGMRFYREMERLIQNVCSIPNAFESLILLRDATSAQNSRMPSFIWSKLIEFGSWR